MGLPEQRPIGAGAAAADAAALAARRWFIGIGVGEYDDPDLNLGKVLDDVKRMSDWFVCESRVDHQVGLEVGAQSHLEPDLGAACQVSARMFA